MTMNYYINIIVVYLYELITERFLLISEIFIAQIKSEVTYQLPIPQVVAITCGISNCTRV